MRVLYSDFHTMYTRIYLTMLTDSLADITQYVFQVLEVARSVTNQTNNDTAKELFIKRLNESDMYFADKPIPANESDANASVLCSSVEGAKKYCPNRWKAMQNWFAEARKVNNEISNSMLQLEALIRPFFSLPLPPPLLFSVIFLYFLIFPPGGEGGTRAFSCTLGSNSSPLHQPLLHFTLRSFPSRLPRLCF